MYLTPFVLMFPRQGEDECRVAYTRNHPRLPDDAYALSEAYCTDPSCDCRRVMINVLARQQKGVLASISFGFDRNEPMAGPFLDPLNPQSKFSEALLELVSDILEDPAYVARLEAHYRQVKKAVADPSHPVHRILEQDSSKTRRKKGATHPSEQRSIRARRARRRARRATPPATEEGPVGRNDPCPCGSGKKYRRCCGRPTPR